MGPARCNPPVTPRVPDNPTLPVKLLLDQVFCPAKGFRCSLAMSRHLQLVVRQGPQGWRQRARVTHRQHQVSITVLSIVHEVLATPLLLPASLTLAYPNMGPL